MDPHESWIKSRLFPIVSFLLIVNLLVLDYLIVSKWLDNAYKNTAEGKAATSFLIPTDRPKSTTPVYSQTCSPSCLTAIDQAVAPLKYTPTVTPRPKLQQTVQKTTTPTPQPTATSQKANTVQEFFVPLGSGSSTASDWTDVPGVKAEVDSSKYGSIKQVLFETSTRVPDHNQIVWVRLYNETDNYIVGNSEFQYPSGTTQYFRIAEIQLGSGKKTYKVQMKTQLQYTTVLDQARIHITTY